MDRVTKFLRRRNSKERALLMAMIERIASNLLENLDIKKIQGLKNTYRVRVGDFRIIFYKGKTENFILKVDERDDQTYKF